MYNYTLTRTLKNKCNQNDSNYSIYIYNTKITLFGAILLAEEKQTNKQEILCLKYLLLFTITKSETKTEKEQL